MYSSGDDCRVRAWAAADLNLGGLGEGEGEEEVEEGSDSGGGDDGGGGDGARRGRGHGPAMLKPVFSYHSGHAGNVRQFSPPLFFSSS